MRSYPCREAYGLVFIFPGAPEMADRVPLPEVPEFSSPDYRTMYFSREVKCHYTFMHENLMDMNHQFLHRSLIGSIQPDDRLSRRQNVGSRPATSSRAASSMSAPTFW